MRWQDLGSAAAVFVLKHMPHPISVTWSKQACKMPPPPHPPLANAVHHHVAVRIQVHSCSSGGVPVQLAKQAMHCCDAREREKREPGLVYLLDELVPDSPGEPWGADDAADAGAACVLVVPFAPSDPEEHAEQVRLAAGHALGPDWMTGVSA